MSAVKIHHELFTPYRQNVMCEGTVVDNGVEVKMGEQMFIIKSKGAGFLQ
jgi:hypothetical protein